MAIQKFCGRVIGEPKQFVTANTHRNVVHVTVSFMPDVKLTGKLPEFGDNSIPSVQLSVWDEAMQERIMADPRSLIGQTITGYCDNVVKREQYYNATGHLFVIDPKGKTLAPTVQVITQATAAPVAPVAPVAP